MDLIADCDTLMTRIERGPVVGCTLRSLNCAQQDMEGARFDDCRFVACRFRAANLVDSTFLGCAFFDPATETACDFSFADLRGARFERCDLTTSTFERIRGYGIALSHCNAQGASFADADFGLALPQRIETALCDAAFEHCNLAYADFSGTDLTGCTLIECRLTHATLRHARLVKADLRGSELSNVDAHGCILTGADLRGAAFNGLDPRTMDLSGVRITPAQTLMLLEPLAIEIVADD